MTRSPLFKGVLMQIIRSPMDAFTHQQNFPDNSRPLPEIRLNQIERDFQQPNPPGGDNDHTQCKR